MRPEAEGDGDAVDVVRGRQDGRDVGIVRGVPVHGVGAAARRPSAGVVVVGRAGPPQRGAGGRPRATVDINCGVSRFAVRRVMRGRLSGRRRAATADVPPATGGFAGALGLSVSWAASHRVIASLAWPGRLSTARRSAAAGLIAAAARSSASASSALAGSCSIHPS